MQTNVDCTFSGMDGQVLQAARQRENSKRLQEAVFERFGLIACKSCAVCVLLLPQCREELSALVRVPQRRTFPISSFLFVFTIRTHPSLAEVCRVIVQTHRSPSAPEGLQYCLSVSRVC